ncbi:MAG: FtsW/RodA/SpoVE family cell cycle protein [Verrucomicrobiota bacterium]|nr:FtsW/RodA/SpoVE family cell cycle protein [Verrucomicrobiota bacterium]
MTPLFLKILGMNWLLILVTSVLLVMGVYSIHEATSYFENSVLNSKWYDQIKWICIGIVFFIGATLIDYNWIKWGALPAYLVSIILLLSTNTELSGAESWITIGGLTFQPSQLAIISGILFLAVLFGELPKKFPIFHNSFIKIIIAAPITAIPCLIILLEPDFGSSMGWIVIFMTSLLIGKVLFRYIIVIVQLGLIVLPILYFFGLKDYQKERIETWLNMLNDRPVDEQGAAWVPKHNMIAIGSAGYLGKAHDKESVGNIKITDNSIQSKSTLVTEMGFVPPNVAINDFIFVTIAERHGFRGSFLLLLLFTVLLLILTYICYSAKDMTGRMIVSGFIGLLFFHVFMNIGMCILLVPITGLPLPFISYGGTFILMMLFMLGLCQSVWVHRNSSA